MVSVGLLAVIVGCSDNSDSGQPAAGAGNRAGASGSAVAGESGESGGAPGQAGNTSSAGRDSSSAFNCSAPPPGCGGDVVGTWQIEQSCIATLVGTASCPGLTADGTGLTQTGRVTYGADLSYSSTTSISGTLKTVYPSSCTSGYSCDDLATALSAASPSGYSAPNCTTLSNGCACTFQVSDQTSVETGTYALNGNVLTQHRSSGTSIDIDYCVRDRSLTLASQNPGTGTQAQAVRLDKQ